VKKNYHTLIDKQLTYALYVEEGVVTFVNPLFDWMIGKKLSDCLDRLKEEGTELKIRRKVKK